MSNIKEILSMENLREKVEKMRLLWYGDVKRRSEEPLLKKIEGLEEDQQDIPEKDIGGS